MISFSFSEMSLGLPLGTGDDPVYGLLHLGHVDLVLVVPRRQERRLVDEVRQVGAGKPGVPRASVPTSTSVPNGLPRVWTLRIFSRPGRSGRSTTICRSKLPGLQERRVEYVGAVGGGEHDDPALGVEAVHLDQELVQGLLPLVVATAKAGATLPTDRVDLVHEDDAGAILLGLLEEVAHAAGANADEHLHKVGAGDREEGTPASPATARASSVLPVPGGPTSNAPLGILAPSFWNFWGLRGTP